MFSQATFPLKFGEDESYLRIAPYTCSSIRRVLAKSGLNVPFIRDSLHLINERRVLSFLV